MVNSKKRLAIEILVVLLLSLCFVFLRQSTTGMVVSDYLCTYQNETTVLDEFRVVPVALDDDLKVVLRNVPCNGSSIKLPQGFDEIAVRACTEPDCTILRRTTKTDVALVCGGDRLKTISSGTQETDSPWFRPTGITFDEVPGPLQKAGSLIQRGGVSVTFGRDAYAQLQDGWVHIAPPENYAIAGPAYEIAFKPREALSEVVVSVTSESTLGVLQGDSWTVFENPFSLTLSPRYAMQPVLVPLQRCSPCSKDQVVLLNPTQNSRQAVVLTHGILTDPGTFKKLIEQVATRGWPWKIYVYSYGYNTPYDETARTFTQQLNSIAGSYDSLVLVGHSFGGLVTQAALEQALEDKRNGMEQPFLDKLASVVLVATPNQGTPVLDLYNSVQNNPIGKPFAKALLDADLSEVNIDLLQHGHDFAPVPDVEYVAVAGIRSYDSLGGLFAPAIAEANDGVVSVRSATHIGGVPYVEHCKNFFSINLTHTELLEHPLALRMIEQVIARQFGRTNIEPARYISMPNCEPGQYAVLGRARVPAAEFEICNCGDGMCGAGETAELCPSDCARIQTQGPLCFAIPPLLIAAFVLLVVLIGAHVALGFLRPKRLRVIARIVFLLLAVVAGVLVALLGVTAIACDKNIFGLSFIFLSLLAFLVICEWIMRRRRDGENRHILDHPEL